MISPKYRLILQSDIIPVKILVSKTWKRFTKHSHQAHQWGWNTHDDCHDIMTWKRFLHYKSIVRKIHQSPVDFLNKGHTHTANISFDVFFDVGLKKLTNNKVASDLRSLDPSAFWLNYIVKGLFYAASCYIGTHYDGNGLYVKVFGWIKLFHILQGSSLESHLTVYK